MEAFLREIGKAPETDKPHQTAFCGTRMTYAMSGTGEEAVYTFRIDGEKL